MISYLTGKRLACISLLLSTILVMFSCDEDTTSPVPVGDVEGVVLFANTTIPIPNVNIEVDGLTTVSSEEGSYSIERVETGHKTLNANRTGFTPFSTGIDVVEGVITVPIPMFSPVFTASVHGVITGDFTGEPKQGITVVMINPDDSESGISSTSDENGNYQLQWVPLGERELLIKSSGTTLSQQDITLSTTDYELDIEIPEPMAFTDARDGNSYHAWKIGEQIWMQENLAYLPGVYPPGEGSATLERYYVIGYEGTDPDEARGTANYLTYGVLYNWKAAESACPDGWHLPTDDEWKTLEIYLGMDPEDADATKWRPTGAVGTKLKAASGWEQAGNGNNESGFTALPGGSRGDGGAFDTGGIHCNFWTGTLSPADLPWNRFLSYDNAGVSRFGWQKSLGFSVRYVKDN